MKHFAVVGIISFLIAGAIVGMDAERASAVTFNVGFPVRRIAQQAAPRVLTEEYRPLIEWALDRFSEADLPLANVEIGVYDDQTVCGDGRKGLHQVAGDGARSLVLVCALHDSPRLQEGSRRHVLLHELAHVWAEQNLTRDQKQEFLTARGLTVWSGSNALWGELGAEHAAEILAWGVSAGPYLPHSELSDRSCDGFEAGYEQLTGNVVSDDTLPTCS